MAYFGQKVIFSVSDISERSKESISRFPANFKKISESRIFDLSRDPTSHRAKISLFQNMLGFIQYGSRLFGIDAISDSAKFQDDWLSESGLNVKFQNRKMANLTNEKAEFAIAIFRHFSPFFAIGPPPPPIHPWPVHFWQTTSLFVLKETTQYNINKTSVVTASLLNPPIKFLLIFQIRKSCRLSFTTLSQVLTA